MIYCSMDIESWRQKPRSPEGIAMISMVKEDTEHPEIPVESLPHLTVIIRPCYGYIQVGTLTALAMNAWLMVAIEMHDSRMTREKFHEKYKGLGIPHETLVRAGQAIFFDKYPVMTMDEYLIVAQRWLDEQFGIKDHITLAGKNVMGFDYHFLPEDLQARFRYSGADPGSMFWDTINDRQLPGTEQVMKRAGVEYSNGHDALSDARMIISAIRKDPKIVLKQKLEKALELLKGCRFLHNIASYNNGVEAVSHYIDIDAFLKEQDKPVDGKDIK